MINLINDYLERYKNEIVGNLVDIIKIPSIYNEDGSGYPYGKESARAIDYCMDLCSRKGLITRNYDYYCAKAKLSNSIKDKKIVIAAHVDVVDADPRSIYDSFEGEIVDNYVVGRGSVDNKGPLIAIIYALNFFKENNIELKNDFVLLFGANEENGMDDIEYYLKKEGEPDLGISVDNDFPVLIGEKSTMIINLVGKKSSDIKSIVSHKNTQRLMPYVCNLSAEGIEEIFEINENSNTILNLIRYLKEKEIKLFSDKENNEAIEKLLFGDFINQACENFSDEKITIMPILINTTEDDDISIKIYIRYKSTINSKLILNAIYGFLEKSKLKKNVERISDGYSICSDDEVVKLLTKVYNENSNTNMEPYVMNSGSTYARKFKRGIGFGAGKLNEVKPFVPPYGQCHGPDEAHNIDTLMHAIKIYILGFKALDEYYVDKRGEIK